MAKSSYSTASIVAGGIALTGTVTAASLWNIFRRRTSYLTNDDLLADPVGDLQVARRLTPADREGLKEAISASFDYLHVIKEEKSVSSELTADESLDDETESSLQDSMDSEVDAFVDYVLHIAEHYGHIIKSVDNGGNYQASVCVVPPVSQYLYKAYNLKAMIHANLFSWYSWRELLLFSQARRREIEAFDDRRLSKATRPILKGCLSDQWLVLNMCVAPSASGKRLVPRMMQQVLHLANGAKVIWHVCTTTFQTPVSHHTSPYSRRKKSQEILPQ